MTRFKKIIVIICVIAITGIFNYWLWGPRRTPSATKEIDNIQEETNVPVEPSDNSTENTTEASFNPLKKEQQDKPEDQSDSSKFSPSVNLIVPFTSQAPYAKWDELHNEACEESALIIAQAWLKNEQLSAEKVEAEILKLVKWQEEQWGGHYDLPSEEVVEMAKEYFQIEKIRLTYGISLEDIKKEISLGNLVIVPAAGRVLKNPYYRQPGPYYHMLVVVGYNKKEIITNDPGTKRGQGFPYSYQNFYEAIRDWPGPLGTIKDEVNILSGRKAMIVVEK